MTPRILIADDEPVTRVTVQKALAGYGWEIVVAQNGREAAAHFDQADAPEVAVVDWMMPDLDGSELCRLLRKKGVRAYLIMLTGRSRPEDLVQALDSGADDYVRKPFHWGELVARIKVGLRITALQSRLEQNVDELKASLAKVKQLTGLLPICSYCKRIRDDKDYWSRLESYLSDRSEVEFTHGICPECLREALKEIEASKK